MGTASLEHVQPVRLRVVAALVCLGTAVWLVSWPAVQHIEASLSSWFLRGLGAGGTAIGPNLLVVDSTRHNVPGVPPGGFVSGGFEIAPSCSVAMFLAVLLVASAVMALTGRVRLRRLPAMTIGFAIVFLVVSQVRLVVSGLLIHRLGQENGFPIAHVLVGTVISTAGIVLGIAGFVMLAMRPSRRGSPPTADAPDHLRPTTSPNSAITGEP